MNADVRMTSAIAASISALIPKYWACRSANGTGVMSSLMSVLEPAAPMDRRSFEIARQQPAERHGQDQRAQYIARIGDPAHPLAPAGEYENGRKYQRMEQVERGGDPPRKTGRVRACRSVHRGRRRR